MKFFYRIKRDGVGLWVKMYSDCKDNWYAASRQITHRREAAPAFKAFVEDVKREVGS